MLVSRYQKPGLTVHREKQPSLLGYVQRKFGSILIDLVKWKVATVRRKIVAIAVIRHTDGALEGDAQIINPYLFGNLHIRPPGRKMLQHLNKMRHLLGVSSCCWLEWEKITERGRRVEIVNLGGLPLLLVTVG